MKNKALIILVFIFSIQFISSCCRDVRFYDFKKMEFKLSSKTIGLKDSLEIKLSPLDINFISMNLNHFSFNSAYAYDCENGWGGMKYPFEKIEITSENDFDSKHLKEQLLNDIFQLKVYTGFNSSGDKFEMQAIDIGKLNLYDIVLILKPQPIISKIHNFKIKLTKSNKEEIIINTGDVVWN